MVFLAIAFFQFILDSFLVTWGLFTRKQNVYHGGFHILFDPVIELTDHAVGSWRDLCPSQNLVVCFLFCGALVFSQMPALVGQIFLFIRARFSAVGRMLGDRALALDSPTAALFAAFGPR